MTSTSKPLKSALDLALERMAQRDGSITRLTDAQKAALAEIDNKTRAKLAELEILGSDRLTKVGDDPEQIEKIKAEQRAAMEKVRSRTEDEKERVRKG